MARFERNRDDNRNSYQKRDFSRDSRPKRREFEEFDERPRRSRDFKPEMTKAVCSSCHKECEVPFKPTSSKPVFCSDCYRKNDGRSDSRSSDKSALETINTKLDKIMKALKID